jgi:cyclopropane-fatty-acyl-phospholipid synthase
MKRTSPERLFPELFASAGIDINGSRPWDIQVHHGLFYKRLLAGGSMALGESYMDGWWDCEALDRFFERILQFQLDQKAKQSIKTLWCSAIATLTCSPGRFRAFNIGRHHYDIGNELFALMLDKWMNYSCAYWKEAGDLDAAQASKMDLICRKLQLQPGMRILDIGCGWGGLAAYAAQQYGVAVVGITVSHKQVQLARKMCEGLPVTIEQKDYREVQDTFAGCGPTICWPAPVPSAPAATSCGKLSFPGTVSVPDMKAYGRIGKRLCLALRFNRV